MPHENLVQSLSKSIRQQEANRTFIQPRSEVFLPSAPNQQQLGSYAQSLKRVIKVDDDSDTESVASYKTAPDHWSDHDDTTDEHASDEMNLEHIERTMSDLQDQLNLTRSQSAAIQELIQKKNAAKEALRIKKLEESVRQSIMKRKREAPSPSVETTPASSESETPPFPTLLETAKSTKVKKRKRTLEKGKQRADSSMYQPMTMMMNANSSTSQDSYTDCSMLNYNPKPGKDLDKVFLTEPMIPTFPNPTKKKKNPPAQVSTTSLPEGEKPADIRKQVLASFVDAGITVRQMKILLVDLYHRAIETGLNGYQEIHAREIRKRVIIRLHDNDNDTVMFTLKKKGRANYTPPNKLFLPPHFYGHAERIDYEKYVLKEDDVWDALKYFKYFSPLAPLPERRSSQEPIAQSKQVKSKSFFTSFTNIFS